MLQKNPWQSYRQVATTTASPGQLILMLYEGALRFLELAHRGFSEEDPLPFNQTIINELNLTLNMEAGGQFSQNMRRLYSYLERRLQESNQYKQQEGLNEVIQRLTVLRDAWSEMLSKQGEGEAALTSLAAVG